ncbi:MAG: heme lyase CcmF/NrfE family subunit [Pseudohongiellaceae bacterium]
MIPELGNFAAILALCLALALTVVPMAGAFRRNELWMGMARPLTAGIWVFLLLSFACLAQAFLADDFSVAYVARNSNTALPVYYKFAAVWGAHEGSLLLWVLILATWAYAVSLLSRDLPLDILARVLSVMGLVTMGFLLFLLFTSNPFERMLLNTPSEGSDLNPLLQDFGLTVHPPFLYMGYVGFSVAFAFAIAALLSGRLDAAWARWTRPWTNAAWAFLTIGIALGSWWAYYELGWGGWWFWDPVENVSFMPWLVGTALIHSLAVTEKRGVFKSWTVLLAIAAFSLSLLGAFIVRSGVITSVHAFAVDPERGMVLLALLLVIIGGSLFLYALRAPVVRGSSTYAGWSREIFLLVNNIILVVSMAMILLGTLFPLIHEAIYGEANRVSVGPPYFNTIFLPLMALLAVFLGISTFSRWKKTSLQYLKEQLWKVGVASVGLGILVPMLVTAEFNPGAMLALALALWITLGIAVDLRNKTANKASRIEGLRALGLSYWGMQLAHFGVAVIICGICFTSHYSIEDDIRMEPGDTHSVGGYDFVFEGVTERPGPNFTADSATIRVLKDGSEYLTMHPEKRRYHARGDVQTEADIRVGFFRDLFTALGDPRGDTAWVVRIHFKPFVFWIWFGAFLMAAGGVLAVLDKRYRRQRVKDAAPLGTPALPLEAA